MRVLIAPDSFGGTLTPSQAAEAIARGWRDARPDDEVVTLPLSDGGEGLVDALRHGAWADAEVHDTEVADTRGLARDASFLLRDDVAVVESAQACGLALVPADERDPGRATTWGVGMLLDAAREAGARRIVVGIGGTGTIDGGAGAVSGMGGRLTVADGSGLKVGGHDLPRVTAAARTWMADWSGVEVELLCDVDTVYGDAAAMFGPQKGADVEAVLHAVRGLSAWAAVAERDLGADTGLTSQPGSGAGGGLGYGIAAALGGRWLLGAPTVAAMVGFEQALDGADVVVTGEGRLDATTARGKVVHHVVEASFARRTSCLVVAGQAEAGAADRGGVELASPDGVGEDPAGDVRAAAARVAEGWDAEAYGGR